MSVDGSIDTVALLDLLRLLSTTRKTGQLHVTGGRLSGQVSLLDGDLTAADVGRARTDLDAVFQLLRVTSGRFSFDTDVALPPPVRRVPLLGLIDDALGKLAEWREIELVVPSLDSVVRLNPELRGSDAMVGADQWRVIAAVGRASDVLGILDGLDLEEFEGCRVIKELVENGFVRVEEPEEGVEEPVVPVYRARAMTPEITRQPEIAQKPEITRQPENVRPAEPESQPMVRPAWMAAATPSVEEEPDPSPRREQAEVQVVPDEAPNPDPVPDDDAPSDPTIVSSDEDSEVDSSSTPTDSELDEPLSRGTLLKFLSSMQT